MAKQRGQVVQTKYGQGYYNPNNPLSQIPIEDGEGAERPASPGSEVADFATEQGEKYAKKKAMEYLESEFAAGAAPAVDGANALASTAEANQAWNSLATGGEVLPEIGAEGGGVYAGASEGMASGVLPYAGAAAGLYGLYNIGTKWGSGDRSAGGLAMGAAQGAASGAAVGSVVPGVGTLIGGVAGGLYGLAGSAIKTGKHEDQLARDAVRSQMMSNKFIDKDYNVTLADGNKFDVGRDGGASLKNTDGSSRPMYNTDSTDTRTGQIIGDVNPLAQIMTGGDDKLSSDFAGYLTNAAASSGDARANSKKFYTDAGFDKAKAWKAIEDLDKAGAFKEKGEKDAYLNGLNVIFGDQPVNQSTTPKDPALQTIAPSTQKLPGGIQKPVTGIRDSMFLVGRDGPAPDWMTGANNKIPNWDEVTNLMPTVKLNGGSSAGIQKALSAYR